ncbi:hypothetical protein EDE05_12844 [Neorhizobium sp. R1-B]|nr:hypothetical protein EDE05_12844 [Neorhizobium sp. R1-B]
MVKFLLHSSRPAAGAPAPAREAPKTPMFQFRLHCPGGLKFDVQAATEEDARQHVRRRHSSRITKVEFIGEVKRHAPIAR